MKSLCGSRTDANKGNQVGMTSLMTVVLQRLVASMRCFPQCVRTYMPGCQRRHLRLDAPVHGLAWYVTCCCVFLFERWYLDIEELQTHHIWQIILTYKRCRVTNIRVQAF